MRYTLCTLALGLIAPAGPAVAAELKIMEPADRTIVRGPVTFKIKTELAPGEQFLSAPEVAIRDEYGQEIRKARAPYNKDAGIFSVGYNTAGLKDGLYIATVTYRHLAGGKPQEAREDLTLGVRNKPARPARFAVDGERIVEATVDESAELTVRVFDEHGLRMPGARVTLTVDRGELDSPAEITDSQGEAIVSLTSEQAAAVTLTITVEQLPPVTRVIRFKPAP